MFSWYKYLIVGLVFSHLGFWSGSLFLIAPFPDLCLLVLFHMLLCGEKFELYWIHLVLPLLLDSVVVLFRLALAKSNFHAIIFSNML